MPDKRQESKQRRAARNRASREALAARRDNALTSPTPATTSSGSSKGGANTGATGEGGAASTSPGPPPSRGITGMLQSRRPGDKAVLASLALAVVAAIYLLFYRVPADDRGEPLPAVFRGLAKAARERLTGEPVPDNTVSLVDASGPQIFLVLALPVAVALFAVWANRRPDRSRMLTFAMLAMAGSVILTGGIGIFFFPALIALAVGGFRVRKADLPARVAERATAARGRGGRGRGAVIEADSEDVTDADDDRPRTSLFRSRRQGRDAAGTPGAVDTPVPGDGEPADAPVDAGASAGADEADPLAELEAEIEAERAAEAEAQADDTDDRGPTGRSRRKR